MKLYTTSEVSKKTGLNKKTLRGWEKEFELKVSRDDNGNRNYTDYDIELIQNIKKYKQKGMGRIFIMEYIDNVNFDKSNEECAATLTQANPLESIGDIQRNMAENFKNIMGEAIGDIVIEREQKLKEDLGNEINEKLDDISINLREEISNKVRKQVRVENQKLMLYLANNRKENKKGFFSKVFG
ncbi:MAG: helix-turn-helix domain-containing protein [Tepidibacter sp.]|uniref:helix-turn-helix domain-containing protein n=1 Tax=Tepidibacter sp. TaxID=2529387 RepID=UPI0025FE2DFE|nr:helix-turn-helix domain-containing protein [Tepidibacter sp.]MCT4509129.1 helix-turn-helix domain-containing protein [Tepidibacter sp.]